MKKVIVENPYKTIIGSHEVCRILKSDSNARVQINGELLTHEQLRDCKILVGDIMYFTLEKFFDVVTIKETIYYQAFDEFVFDGVRYILIYVGNNHYCMIDKITYIRFDDAVEFINRKISHGIISEEQFLEVFPDFKYCQK